MMIELGIGFCLGIIVKSLYNRFFKKEIDMSVEQAIQLLKEKGYYTNLNISPEDKKKWK